MQSDGTNLSARSAPKLPAGLVTKTAAGGYDVIKPQMPQGIFFSAYFGMMSYNEVFWLQVRCHMVWDLVI